MVEQSAVNRSVVGSSPTRGANIGPLVKRLRHRPFTAVSRVRFPDGSPHGRLAQLGERLPYKQDVGSSILSSSTICGNSSAVEHRLAKAGVASSNLVSRSIHSSIAQLVEQSAVNRSVVGSSPTRGANIGPLVKRLRHRPFTAVSRVRFPDGSPHGRLAQLGERLPYKQDVGSSILSSSTTVRSKLTLASFLLQLWYTVRYSFDYIYIKESRI